MHRTSNLPEPSATSQYSQLSYATQQSPIHMLPYRYPLYQQLISEPTRQQHVFWRTTQPMTPPPGCLGEFSYPPNAPHTTRMSTSPLGVNEDMVYRCNIIEQLQGNYEIKTPAGNDQISVMIPSIAKDDEKLAIVHRICSNGEALADQIIYEEQSSFTLCSNCGAIEAVMMKGSNMKHSVKWENIGGGVATIWRRKGEVTFNLVQLEVQPPTTSRRNPVLQTPVMINIPGRLYSMGICGTLSPSSGSSGESPAMSVPNSILPELNLQNCMPPIAPVIVNPSSGSHATNGNPTPFANFERGVCNSSVGSCIKSPNQLWSESTAPSESYPHTMKSFRDGATDIPCTEYQQAMFELVKAHCIRKPCLLKKLIHWGMRNTAFRHVSPNDANNLAKGRIWVSAHPAQDREVDISVQENLEDIKGAYREVKAGVYKQPKPKVSEPGTQHRLLKTSCGHWKIEELDLESGMWHLCAQELSDGRWVDMKNNRKEILVQLVPMIMILQKLGEGHVAKNEEVEKFMEFLFKSCNQKKLNSKLKGRNLRHNIDNLKIKLEKQYSLCFAVQVASIADSIAKEREAVR